MLSLDLPDTVDIREVGLRDGLQLEQPIPTAAKLEILEAIVASGVRRIEATSFVSAKAVPALADADRVAAQLSHWPGISFSALVANARGAVRAVDAGVTDLEYVVSAADAHSKANTGGTTAQSVQDVSEIAEIVHAAAGRLEVIVAVAWDCPFEGPTPPQRVADIAAASVSSGADALCLADTIGTTTPRRLLHLLELVQRAHPERSVGIHLHDTRGTGQANALAAILAGVRQLDASLGGLGGCPFAPGASGNIATEELLYWLHDCGIATGVDITQVVKAASLAERAVGHDLSSSYYRAEGRGQSLADGRPR